MACCEWWLPWGWGGGNAQIGITTEEAQDSARLGGSCNEKWNLLAASASRSTVGALDPAAPHWETGAWRGVAGRGREKSPADRPDPAITLSYKMYGRRPPGARDKE